VVFLNEGARTGDRHDGFCPDLPRERFYGNGEEDEELQLPPGYGYPIGAHDRWRMSWMVMNHRNRQDKGWIEYTVTVDDDPALIPVKPFWLDVAGCGNGSIFSVPGGEAPGAVQDQTLPWVPPADGRIVAFGSHLHGGALTMKVTEPDCGDRTLVESRPTYGTPDNVYYRIRPVLHEPGPIATGWVESSSGVPVHQGENLTVHGDYDAEHPHPRVMAIAHAYVAYGGAPVPEGCASLPEDTTTITTNAPGRTDPPVTQVPLTGLDRHGNAVTISRPPGRNKTVDGNVTVLVRNWTFSAPNLSVPAGATVTWKFADTVRHGVMLANGPRAFASRNLRNGATYSQRLDVPGTYQLLCPLHPVAMTEAIGVRPSPA
jgi:plastocyanin